MYPTCRFDRLNESTLNRLERFVRRHKIKKIVPLDDAKTTAAAAAAVVGIEHIYKQYIYIGTTRPVPCKPIPPLHNPPPPKIRRAFSPSMRQ